MKRFFYDIESLENLFTVATFDERLDANGNHPLIVYYILDDPETILTDSSDRRHAIFDYVRSRVRMCNGNLPENTAIGFMDLNDQGNSLYFAKAFCLGSLAQDPDDWNAVSVERFLPNDPWERPVCDFDPEFDPDVHPYIMGYNSYNYDMTMLARLFENQWLHSFAKDGTRCLANGSTTTPIPTPVTARFMRRENDELFKPENIDNMPQTLRSSDDLSYGDEIRQVMLLTGRFLDVAALNEKQRKVGLKRIEGMLGLQIMESDKLTEGRDVVETYEDLAEVKAYNVSDVINLRAVASSTVYSKSLKTKMHLLDAYPENIHPRIKGSYKPDMTKIDKRRLRADSTSARFATKVLCPYDHLDDLPAVSFMYPHPKVAAERGLPVADILEQARDLFHEWFDGTPAEHEFDAVCAYYERFRGKSFNGGKDFASKHPGTKTYDLDEFSSDGPTIHYFRKDGTPSSCLITFGVGGAHGLEYNKALYDADAQYDRDLAAVRASCPDPLDFYKAHHKIDPDAVMADGRVVPAKSFLMSSSNGRHASWKRPLDPKLLVDAPGRKAGTTHKKLNKRYAYTSVGLVNHDDGSGYYPSLLINMCAFENEGLGGEDRYAGFKVTKDELSVKMRDPRYTKEEQAEYAQERSDAKLITNATSGAAATLYESAIKMDNRILSMRIIGQLIIWIIGQTQALEGARVISTNTDGLFSILDATTNDTIMAEMAKRYAIAFPPETCFIVSKDANNRIQFNSENRSEVDECGGGAFASYDGPSLEHSLDHPAIIDWALGQYLKHANAETGIADMTLPFDMGLARRVFMEADAEFDLHKRLLMYQNVVSASSDLSDGMNLTCLRRQDGTHQALQRFNRVFLVREGLGEVIGHEPQTLCYASARAVGTKVIASRRARGEREYVIDSEAREILLAHGYQESAFVGRDVTFTKVKKVDPSWPVIIANESMVDLPDDHAEELLDALDVDRYVTMLKDTYVDSWQVRGLDGRNAK